MRVMVLVKATEDSEKGFSPTPEMKGSMKEMDRFNDELIKAGIMKKGDCDGLKPLLSGQAHCVRWPGPPGHRWSLLSAPRTGRWLLVLGCQGRG